MVDPDRARRLRILLLALLVGGIIFALLPKNASQTGPMKKPEGRRAMTDFALAPVAGGEPWRLADQRGKVLLVNFWATWCPPCRRETPDLVEVHGKYGPRGFGVVGISMDEDPAEVVPDFVQQYKVPYPMLMPSKQFSFQEISTLPASFLLDRRGRIARSYVGAVTAEELAQDIETLLAEAN